MPNHYIIKIMIIVKITPPNNIIIEIIFLDYFGTQNTVLLSDFLMKI